MICFSIYEYVEYVSIIRLRILFVFVAALDGQTRSICVYWITRVCGRQNRSFCCEFLCIKYPDGFAEITAFGNKVTRLHIAISVNLHLLWL